MAFIHAPNVGEFRINQRYIGQEVQNTLYFRPVGTVMGAAWLTSFAGELAAWWQARIAPNVGAGLSLNNVTGVDLTTDSGPVGIYTPTSPVEGTKPGNALPGNVTWCVTFKSPKRGRSYRGRNYIAGLVDSTVTGNTLDIVTANAFRDGYAALLDVPFSDAGEWVLVSRYHDKAPRAVADVVGVNAVGYHDLFLDSQRRRLPGRGL